MKNNTLSSKEKRAEQYINNSKSKEQWKAIPNTRNRYYISTDGRVLSLCYNEPQILKPFTCGKNYLCVRINKKNQRLHRLVAQAFIENNDNLPLVHHKDNNKHNNRVDNL